MPDRNTGKGRGMINHPLTSHLPARWWQPVARPHSATLLTHIAYGVFFAIGAPLSAVGWYFPYAFRVAGWVARCCDALTHKQAVGERKFGANTLLFPLFDSYWCCLAFRTFVYEDELSHVFRNIPKGSIDLFIDGGANIGLWSVVASNLVDKVVAVEVSPAILSMLKASASMASRPFEVVERALWNKSNETLSFSWSKAKHAASSLTAVAAHDVSNNKWRAELVPTISVDDLVNKKAPADRQGIIFIKLDTEGAETQVIDGASRTLSSDRVLLVYEDHAQDHLHKATAHVLERGMTVYYLNQDGLQKIGQLADVEAIKKDPRRGYNFFACKTGGPAERLLVSMPVMNEAAGLCLSAPLA
jgi:FkbM family methyltransferase